jgi:hypothetical protein
VLVVTFANRGTLVVILQNSILPAKGILRDVKAMPYFPESLPAKIKCNISMIILIISLFDIILLLS